MQVISVRRERKGRSVPAPSSVLKHFEPTGWLLPPPASCWERQQEQCCNEDAGQYGVRRLGSSVLWGLEVRRCWNQPLSPQVSLSCYLWRMGWKKGWGLCLHGCPLEAHVLQHISISLLLCAMLALYSSCASVFHGPFRILCNMVPLQSVLKDWGAWLPSSLFKK